MEVYQDGIGWLPMEVTQGLEEKPQTTDDDADNGDTSKKKPPKGKELEEGAKISVRGLGKMKLRSINGQTKKGRISVVIDRYI